MFIMSWSESKNPLTVPLPQLNYKFSESNQRSYEFSYALSSIFDYAFCFSVPSRIEIQLKKFNSTPKAYSKQNRVQ